MREKPLKFLMAVSVPLLLAVFFCGILLAAEGRQALQEGPPDWSAPALLRTGAAFLLSVMAVWGGWVYRLRGALTPCPAKPPVPDVCAYALSGFLAFSAVLFLISPGAYNASVLEDGFVEWLSAGADFAAAAVMLYVFLKNPRSATALALPVALVFFCIGMEEISWGQRIIGFQTPASFVSDARGALNNVQQEFNFHNFATHHVEFFYYLGGFAVFVFLPFVWDFGLKSFRFPRIIAPYVPSRAVAYAAAPLAACNYNLWNVFPTQVQFFTAVGVLAAYAALAGREGRGREAALAVAVLVSCVASQAVFLFYGARFVRLWDVTEYKEFFIACGCLAYAAEVCLRKPWRNAATPGASRS